MYYVVLWNLLSWQAVFYDVRSRQQTFWLSLRGMMPGSEMSLRSRQLALCHCTTTTDCIYYFSTRPRLELGNN